MTTATMTGQAVWTAWHRDNARSPWRRAFEAGNEADCWRAVLRDKRGGDWLVTWGGTDPNRPAPRAGSRR